ETVPQEQVAAPADAPEEAPEALAGSKEAVEVAEAVVDAPGPEALAEPEEVAEVAEAVAHVPASEAPAADETAESGGAASDAETNDAKETN
ncbi:MAG: hypothetical protein OXF26_02140, partial [Alphaproteobacteria bacterium]|nr:hypothetical protein [Alphaproteobacteria bacterium]